MTDETTLGRRAVLGLIGGSFSSCLAGAPTAAAPGASLSAWQPGTLDIHHISTGRGNCALLVLPDGTTAMIDAGAKGDDPPYVIDPKPDGSRRPGEWLGRYARRHLAAAGRREIDYFILTHLHDDHMGAVYPGLPPGPGGGYRLTGVSDVAALVPISRFIDRDFPGYAYPTPQTDPSATNYIAFIRHQQSLGRIVERFAPGSERQIVLLRDPARFGDVRVRNLAANGEVWTGSGSATRKLFPDLATLKPADYPTENMCCLALRLSYGAFDYYTGGDLSCADDYGAAPWRDIETPVARAAGPVEVAVVNHHGYADADGPGFVRALRPQAFIIEAWDSAHPVVSTLANLRSKRLYPADRDIYATAMKEENRVANKEVRTLKSTNGHVIVRVAPGGHSYRIIVTTNADESDRVIASYGPFQCGSSG